MAEVQPTSVQLRMPADPQLLRVLRLVGSGLASLGQLDLTATEEVRVAVDELGAALISMGDGGPIELSFDLTPAALCIEGTTSVAPGAGLDVDPLTDRMLSVVATTHTWSVQDGRTTGRLEKALPQPSMEAGSR
jgi:anti-sigma regulatory factor (Ser/Thr protein kinase)